MVSINPGQLWGRPSHLHILSSTRPERAMMVVGGIRQMVSLSPENVNNGRSSLRIFESNVHPMFL